jgi:hypothetical protein
MGFLNIFKNKKQFNEESNNKESSFKELKKTNDDVNKLFESFKDFLISTPDYNPEILEIQNTIKLKKVVLVKEVFLNKISIKLDFSRKISSKLKLIQDDFNEIQINKLTRFITFLEKEELRYNELYRKCVSIYIENPHDDIFNQLSSQYFSVLNYYKIFTSLLENVKKDKIKFNRFYNIIEDDGIFMTKTELETFNYLKGIKVLNDNLVEGFNQLKKELEYIDGSLTMIDSSLQMINDSTNDIYLSL